MSEVRVQAKFEPAIERDVVVRMPQSIAEVLLAVVGGIGGGGPERKAMDEVYYALISAGVPSHSPKITFGGQFTENR